MADVYQTSPIGAGGESHVVVVHCSDPRYQPHFQEFLRIGLGLEHYALIAVPGGAQWLTLADYLPKFSWTGWRFLKFVHQVAKADRVILIAHDTCLWYQDLRFAGISGNVKDRQMSDLRRARNSLVERFGQLQVECYYATFEGDRARFATA